MAAWDIRNLFQAIAPGVSGAMNPLAFIGAGMAQGNPLGALQSMGQLQMQAQQIRQRREQAYAMNMMQAHRQRQLQEHRAKIMEMRQASMNQPPAMLRNAEAYAGATPELQAVMDKIRTGPQTVVNVGDSQYGSVPSGSMMEETAEGRVIKPLRGSDTDVKRREGVAKLQAVSDDIHELEALVAQHGTEAFGDVARRMEAIQNRIVGNLPAIRDTGVLQEGELKRIEEELPSGTSPWKTGAQVLPHIRGFREEVDRKLADKRRIYGIEDVSPAGRPAPQNVAPAPGTVEDGYRFSGGDPADPANWKPVL